MPELTGVCCSGTEAIKFMELLACLIPEDARTDDFCKEYEAALNRFRFEAAKGIGKKKTKAMNKGWKDFLSCGQCGFGANDNCGTAYLY